MEINVDATGSCTKMPDSIIIHFCDPIKLTPAMIRKQLAKMDFEIDSIRKNDSCIWEQSKRNKLIDFAAKNGVNKSRLEQLLSTLDGGLPSISSTGAMNQDFQAFLDCEAELQADSIDSIINMKREFSDVLVLFKDKDTSPANYYEKSQYISLLDETLESEEYTIDQSMILQIYYKSPWEINKKTCSDFIPIKFVKHDLEDPIIVYNGDTIQQKDTIYLCLGNEPDNLEIHKSFRDYNVYAKVNDTAEVQNITFNGLVDQTFNEVAIWNIHKAGFLDTDKPGLREVSLWQKDLAQSCNGTPFEFFIKVLDLKIDQLPDLTKNPENTFCQSLNPEDSIKLFVTKTPQQIDYDVYWYNVTKDAADNLTRTKIGVGDTIYVPKDSVENKQTTSFRYDVTFYKDHCESNPSTIEITVNPAADTLKTDTIVICQYYRPTTDDVIDALQALNSTGYDISNLLFYSYDETFPSDADGKIRHAIEKDSISLDRLLDMLDTDSPCGTDGYRLLNFVVQGKTAKGC
ncbi:MAG: hypothetical protein J6T83_05490, partial [Paludibacteraceae bacterium]|nr:hypothetical protein [Paludibacteraceae bacterium]